MSQAQVIHKFGPPPGGYLGLVEDNHSHPIQINIKKGENLRTVYAFFI